MLFSKLAHWSLRSLASAPKIKMYPFPQKFSNSFYGLISSHICYNVSCEVVTKDQNIHCVWWLVQFHCCLNAGEIHMKQLQRRDDQNGLEQSLGMGTFMMNTPFTVTDHSLHLHCHARPPELAFQQGQCLLLTLVSSIPMASVHGHHSVSHGNYELHHFFQLSSWSMTVIEGTLVECEFLPFPKDGHTFFHGGMVPQEMY